MIRESKAGVSRRHLLAATMASGAGLAFSKRAVRLGHHFYNWDRAWDKDLDLRLRLTKETGWEGFEAKPEEIGVPAAELRRKCADAGVECVAIGGGVREAIDYAHAAGAGIVRSFCAKEEAARWVAYAAERGILIAIHNHAGSAVETREDLLRALDERPGTVACPDTGHLLLYGSDPAVTIRELGERCRYIHLKDIDPAGVGSRKRGGSVFCELGSGALDLGGVLAALDWIGYSGWLMVERDRRVSDYVRSARNMREVLRRRGY